MKDTKCHWEIEITWHLDIKGNTDGNNLKTYIKWLVSNM